MRSVSRIALLLVLGASVATAAFAERLETPRQLGPGKISMRLPMASSYAPLSVGNLKVIAAGSGWVSSDLEQTIYGTEPYWCNTEQIAILGVLVANKSKPVNEKLTIKH